MKEKGFTLIELLVVMTIIAILAGLALVSYQGARKTARDGKRKADMETIRSALEMYRADNGEYPPTTSGACGGGWDRSSCNPNFLEELTSPDEYLAEVPEDPLNTSDQQAYVYQLNSTYGYRLMYNPETVPDNQDPDPDDCYSTRWVCLQAP